MLSGWFIWIGLVHISQFQDLPSKKINGFAHAPTTLSRLQSPHQVQADPVITPRTVNLTSLKPKTRLLLVLQTKKSVLETHASETSEINILTQERKPKNFRQLCILKEAISSYPLQMPTVHQYQWLERCISLN